MNLSHSFHGHDVLELIASRGEAWPLAEFTALAAAAFGPAPKFHNCHSQGFTLDELLHFFAERGKVTLAAGTLAMGPVAACSH
jgi:probable metal-binding protein